MISHRHRCIYIKVPKCASTSVQEWFIAHGKGRPSFPRYWYPGPLPHRIQWTARALELYPGYFTFTFLRDPYRRFLSLYRHANRTAAHRAGYIAHHPKHNGTLREFSLLCAELLAETGKLWGNQARNFLRENATRRYGPLGRELRHLTYVFNHVRPQVDFLPDRNPERLFGIRRSNHSPIGLLGRVETINEDFARLQERLRLPRVPLPQLNTSIPDPPVDYDAVTRQLVQELYAEDLALLADLPRAISPLSRAAEARPGIRTRFERAKLNLLTMEIALEHQLNRMPAPRSVLAPLARLRRGKG